MAADHARDPSSMFEVLRDFQNDGFSADMVVKEGARVLCKACDVESAAADFEVVDLRRLEGASDPGDMSAVVGVHCPRCNVGGVLVLRYGPEAGAEDADVLAALDTP
jgi:hypothetical protein